jgi:hypothetical protein
METRLNALMPMATRIAAPIGVERGRSAAFGLFDSASCCARQGS